MNDSLGDRMKQPYENRTRAFLPRRTYTIIRLDGKAFHTYTRGLEKPFDKGLIEDIDSAVKAILPEIQGAQFAYVQSDEVSILLTDFEKPTTCAWFDGNVQKICSVSASLMTREFDLFRTVRKLNRWIKENGPIVSAEYDSTINENAAFDARAFTIPYPTEVYNYFVWRNQDAARNSLSMVAQSLYSHKDLQGKNGSQQQEMIFQKGINWADYDDGLKNGRLITREIVVPEGVTPIPEHEEIAKAMLAQPHFRTLLSSWVVKPAWVFTRNPEPLKAMIPKYDC